MKKGNNSKNKQKFKKVKDTILRYSHSGIYVKISVAYVILATTDKHTTTQTKNIHTK